MSPAGRSGRLFIIGGHEARDGDGVVLGALAQLIGNGKLVVATLASADPDARWKVYAAAFRSLGVPHRFHLRIESRADASSERTLRVLDDATAVFFTGGDQLRITSLLGDSAVFRRLAEIFDSGGILAGTSAGASAFSETMLVAGGGDSSHRVHAKLELAPGLGFARDMVIDQHFAERGRIGRLLGVIGQNPRVLGVGIDEDTAIDLVPRRNFRVVGEGGVTVLDGHNVTLSGVTAEDPGRTMSLFGVTLHVLSQSDQFDLRTRLPVAKPAEQIERAVERGEFGAMRAQKRKPKPRRRRVRQAT